MPRRDPNAITTDDVLDAFDLIEGGVFCLKDMGIAPIRVWGARCSTHGDFFFDLDAKDEPVFLRCPEHKKEDLEHWLPVHEVKHE